MRVKIPAKCHCEERPLILSSSKDVAILVGAATAVRRRVFDLVEIATSLPLLAMTAIIPSPLMGEGWGEGEFPRNDKGEGE